MLWGGQAEPHEVAKADGVWRFLTESLYYHLHPRKAMLAVGTFGMVATEEELAAFIRQQRRKVAKLTTILALNEARRLGVE